MSENLNYSKGGTVGYCYGTETTLGEAGANSSGCDSPNGRNYTYTEAMDENSPQGVCPIGWHIPSVAEWQSIIGSGGMSSDFYVRAGNFNTNKTYSPLGWKSRGSEGFYWTSTANNYFIYNMSWINTDADTHAEYFSVRCLKDGTIASPLTLNTWSSGTITSSSSEAWYSFNVTSGITYYVWLDDYDTRWNLTTTFDGKIAAYYSNGTEIFDEDNYIFPMYEKFTATSSGTIYVKVYSYYSTGTASTGAFGVGYTTTSTRPSN
jgi:hypothetical protein